MCPTESNAKTAADACRSVEDILKNTMCRMIECSRGLLARCVLVEECVYSRGLGKCLGSIVGCEDAPYEVGIYTAAAI